VGKTERKRESGKQKQSWKNNIKMDITEYSMIWTGLILPMSACCDYGNEPSGFIKGGELIHQLSDYQLLHTFFSHSQFKTFFEPVFDHRMATWKRCGRKWSWPVPAAIP
jgi:hypothetical protein